MPDEAIGALAERQHGVVARRQLLALGLTGSAIDRRIACGRLHRLHRGIYAVGHRAISREGRWMAAVLAVGGGPFGPGKPFDRWGAAISHRSAAELWQLLAHRDTPVDVSIPGDAGRARRKGIRLHRSLTLSPAHVTLRRGIPVTTPARTIADLRSAASAKRPGAIAKRELRRAVRQAGVFGLPLGDGIESDRTRSDLEGDFLDLCRRHRLPAPEVNVRIGRDLVDFFWCECRLVVETDSYLYHRGRIAFEDDHDRDLRLRTAGYEFLRFSEKQVNEEPDGVARAVARALRVAADADQGP
ncbi:MAG TPA: type IV toxin-antitoxin system AbiEi family antitoxin domain-containing protein [Solirubrobacterales bacterium]|nr:type IV toxin-antitoxin system AbiEi family antitoxin domain-containing protein [Solirubrobacterales bacterium]